MWLTCSQKRMPPPSLWRMNSDRCFPLTLKDFFLLLSWSRVRRQWFSSFFQELINRHLITMAQIDHSENPGEGFGLKTYCCPELKSKWSAWLVHLFKVVRCARVAVPLCFFMVNDTCLQQMYRLRLTATTACFPLSPSPRQTACRRPATSVTSPPVIRRSTARMICLTAWEGYTVRNWTWVGLHGHQTESILSVVLDDLFKGLK